MSDKSLKKLVNLGYRFLLWISREDNTTGKKLQGTEIWKQDGRRHKWFYWSRLKRQRNRVDKLESLKSSKKEIY